MKRSARNIVSSARNTAPMQADVELAILRQIVEKLAGQ